MRGLLLALLAGFLGCAAAEDISTARALEDFYNLDYDAALSGFAAIAREHPLSPDAHNHVAMTVLYRAMLRAGALESEMVTGNNAFLRRPRVEPTPSERRTFDSEVARAISLAEARLARNPRDTRALYALGVSHGLRSTYELLIDRAWRSGLKEANLARKYHNRATEIDPSFIDAKLVQGLHDYMVGSLPWHWRLIAFMAGYHGDKEKGIRTLRQVARDGRENRIDAQTMLCVVYRRERQPKRAVPLLQNLIRRYPRNYLYRMELAQMFSDAGDKRSALATLDNLEQSRPAMAPEKISFARGNIQFWYGDLDSALVNIQKAASAADRLDLNTAVLACMRLGQIHDLRNERDQAREAYRRAAALAPDSAAAKESCGYLSNPYRR